MEKMYPMLFTTLKNYSKQQFLKDLVAGVVVAIIALRLRAPFLLVVLLGAAAAALVRVLGIAG